LALLGAEGVVGVVDLSWMDYVLYDVPFETPTDCWIRVFGLNQSLCCCLRNSSNSHRLGFYFPNDLKTGVRTTNSQKKKFLTASHRDVMKDQTTQTMTLSLLNLRMEEISMAAVVGGTRGMLLSRMISMLAWTA